MIYFLYLFIIINIIIVILLCAVAFKKLYNNWRNYNNFYCNIINIKVLKTLSVYKPIKDCKTTYYSKPLQQVNVNFNNFILKDEVVLVQGKNVYNIYKQGYMTHKAYNICTHNSGVNNSVNNVVNIINKTSKTITFILIQRCYVNVTKPTLYYNSYNNYMVVHYDDNKVLSCTTINNKPLKQMVTYKDSKYVVSKTIIKVKPYQKCKVTRLLQLMLNSTMQTTMQNYKTGYNKPHILVPIDVQKLMFNFYITTGNKNLDAMINYSLPDKIVNKYIQNVTKCSLYDYIYNCKVDDLAMFGYKYIISWLLKRKEYARLYKYIMTHMLGVKVVGNIIKFTKSCTFMGKIVIKVKGCTIVKYNVVDSFYFTYNKVIYNNVNILNLNNKYIEFKK